MDFPQLNQSDHDLRRKLRKKLGPKGAFDFVTDKARDREQSKKRGK